MPAEQGEGPEPVALATQSEVNAMSNRTLLRSPLLRIGAMALLLASGCAEGDIGEPSEAVPQAAQEPAPPTEPVELVITATEFAFDLPASLPAGRYDFTLVNQGEQGHHAQFYKLAEGVSFEAVREAFLARPEFSLDGLPPKAVDLVDPPATGVLGPTLPGETRSGKGALEPGVYAVVCTLSDIEFGTGVSSGTSHHALGMMAELRVT